MKCQTLFSEENKKTISKYCLLKFLTSMLSPNNFKSALHEEIIQKEIFVFKSQNIH